MSAHPAFRFGEYLLDCSTSQLSRAGVPYPIDPEALRLLLFLAEHPGREFTTAELRARLWPSANFLDGERSLNHAVARLREALNDSLASPRYLARTGSGGYRFIAQTAAAGPPARAAHHQRRRRFLYVVIAVQLAVFVFMFLLAYRLITELR